jgi:hypothetical protein
MDPKVPCVPEHWAEPRALSYTRPVISAAACAPSLALSVACRAVSLTLSAAWLPCISNVLMHMHVCIIFHMLYIINKYLRVYKWQQWATSVPPPCFRGGGPHKYTPWLARSGNPWAGPARNGQPLPRTSRVLLADARLG